MATPAPIPTTAPPCVAEDSDVSWVLISSVLVLGMMPGLAFFEAGLLRAKNTTSVVIQIFSGAALMPVLWILFGYSLTLGSNTRGGFIGDFSKALFIGVQYDDCYNGLSIPEALYGLFQMMFATITPLLMTGAYAERLAFRPYLIYSVLWEILVYYPVAHWIWGPGGWLANMGAQDFAGGIVIHTTAGVSSLVAVLMLGQRRDFHKHHGEAPYSSLPLTSIGATMLWTGWFGFNGGSALQAGQSAVHAVMNSQTAAVVCSTCFLFYFMIRTGKASLLQCINGAIAGLAGVTPASGYITVPSAFILGIILAISAQVSIFILKHKLKIDDALDVSSVHGVPGLIGALYIGFAGDSSVGGADGLVFGGGGKLLGVQLLACVVASVWSGVFTYAILKFISLYYPLRVDDHGERLGLDHHQHDEPSTGLDLTRDSSGPTHATPLIISNGSGVGVRASIASARSTRRSLAGLRPTHLNTSSATVCLQDDNTIIVVGGNDGNLDSVDVDEDPRHFVDEYDALTSSAPPRGRAGSGAEYPLPLANNNSVRSNPDHVSSSGIN
jgi:ammonium transporter, Amt family